MLRAPSRPSRCAQTRTLSAIKLAFHGADTDTDTDTAFPARILARKSRVSDVRMYLDVSGESESVSVSVSASWNASLNRVVGRTKLTTPAAVDVLRRNFTEVQTLTVWHKVPEGSIVISEDSRISLQLRAVVYVEGSLCAKNQLDLFHRFQSTEYRLVTDRQTDNHINTGCSPHSTTPTPTPTPTSSTRSSRGS